jgi:hypothetical protein
MATASRAASLGSTADGVTTQALMRERLRAPLRYRKHIMEINKEKVDEMTLALLYLTTFKDKHGPRAWKSHGWDVLDRLHESGYIYDPATKAKSVMLTEEGAERSKRLFEKHFMTD